MAYDQITVDFEEMAESQEEEGDDKGFRARSTFKVAYEDRITFMRDVISKSIKVPGPPVTVSYRNPLRYKEFPRAYARRCQVANKGTPRPDERFGDDRIIRYDYCLITVEFESEPYEFDGNEPYTSERIASDTQFVTLPLGAYKFQTSGLACPGDVGKRMPQTKIDLTWHKVFSIPDSAFSLPGCVNLTTFRGKAPGTLLYIGAQADIRRNIDGENETQVQYSFLHRSIEHNKLLDPATGNWDNAVTVVGGNPIYPSAEFSSLFVL